MADKVAPASGLTGAFDLFGKSWVRVQANLNTFLVLYAFPFLFSFLQVTSSDDMSERKINYFASGSTPNLSLTTTLGAGVILALIFTLVYIFATIMLYALELKAAQGKKPGLSELWQVAQKFWLRIIGLGIVVALLIVGGLLLLIVPGLIVIRRYFLAPFAMLDEDLSITEAMRRSAELSKPYSGAVWSVIGVSVLIGLVSIIPVVGWLISFILAAMYSVAPALRYLELKKLAHSHSAS